MSQFIGTIVAGLRPNVSPGTKVFAAIKQRPVPKTGARSAPPTNLQTFERNIFLTCFRGRAHTLQNADITGLLDHEDYHNTGHAKRRRQKGDRLDYKRRRVLRLQSVQKRFVRLHPTRHREWREASDLVRQSCLRQYISRARTLIVVTSLPRSKKSLRSRQTHVYQRQILLLLSHVEDAATRNVWTTPSLDIILIRLPMAGPSQRPF